MLSLLSRVGFIQHSHFSVFLRSSIFTSALRYLGGQKRKYNIRKGLLPYLRCKHAVLLSVRTWSAGSTSAGSRPRAPPPRLSSPAVMFASLARSNARASKSLQRAGSPRPRDSMASELHATIVSLNAFLVAELYRERKKRKRCRPRRGYGGGLFLTICGTCRDFHGSIHLL